ncbi:large ribosomal subunit protein mL46 [Tribolium castaneum]|uniref:large ribosomal subunit protein mL46 n=1 Tax=Tribolium castaneum TaxID=7070 RepID=UPI0030FED730
MFKYCNLPFLHSRQLSTSAVVREKWDLVTAVCLERKPVITKPLTKIEEDYKTMQSRIEFERSLKSDHEIRHEKEQKQLEQLKKGVDIDVHLKDTAQDLVDVGAEEFAKFKFANRVTEADSRNDLKSLNRKLDKHLVLVTKQKVGKDNLYLLPQALRQDGETLRQAAERILKDTCGSNLKAMIYGNAPSAFYKYKYPCTARKDDVVGAKIFIYFARYDKGQLEGKQVDYKWLDREELGKSLPSEYARSVAQMLIDE